MTTKGLLVAVLLGCMGWVYVDYSSYNAGYEQGRLSVKPDLTPNSQAYKIGFDAGVKQHNELVSANAMAEAQAAFNSYKETIRQQVKAELDNAYKAGANAEAKYIIDHDVHFSEGRPNGR